MHFEELLQVMLEGLHCAIVDHTLGQPIVDADQAKCGPLERDIQETVTSDQHLFVTLAA